MKNIKLLMSLLMVIIMTSCINHTNTQYNNEEIREIVNEAAEKANKLMAGQKLDEMTTALSVKFDGTNFVYTYEIDENLMTIEQLRLLQDNLILSIKNGWDNDPNMIKLKTALKQIEGNAIYHYIGSKSKETHTITIEL